MIHLLPPKQSLQKKLRVLKASYLLLWWHHARVRSIRSMSALTLKMKKRNGLLEVMCRNRISCRRQRASLSVTWCLIQLPQRTSIEWACKKIKKSQSREINQLSRSTCQVCRNRSAQSRNMERTLLWHRCHQVASLWTIASAKGLTIPRQRSLSSNACLPVSSYRLRKSSLNQMASP